MILPLGGTTEVECFQDAPFEEILDTVWDKLKHYQKDKKINLSAKQCVSLTNVFSFFPENLKIFINVRLLVVITR